MFSVSIDELLSGEELLSIAEEDKKTAANCLKSHVLGLLDVMNVVFFFIPVFGRVNGSMIQSVSLINFGVEEVYLLAAYVLILGITTIYGLLEIMFQKLQNRFWGKYSVLVSLWITIVGTVIFIASQQPYMAFFLFCILIIKGVLYTR